MSRLITWIDQWFEETLVSIMLAALIALLGSEVFSRFILGRSFTWIEELCRYLFVWSSYIGVAVAIKRKDQLRVLILMDFLEKRAPGLFKVCYILSDLLFVLFCVLIFYYSLGLLENMSRFTQISGALEIDVFYAYLIMPVSMFLCALRTLQSLYRNIQKRAYRFTNEGC